MAGRRDAKATTLALLGLVCAGPALAQTSNCDSFRLELDNLEASGAVSLARIGKSSPRVNFIKVFQDGCPNTSKACQDRAYLVPGDEVVIVGSRDEFVCAGYASPKGQVRKGWLPRAALLPVQEPPAIQKRDWVGSWQSGPEQTIVLEPSPDQGKLKINGSATWGALDPERAKRGAFNIGELDAEAPVRGEYLSFGMGENGTLPFDEADGAGCRIQMRRLGPYLLAKDNDRCGGNNVTFTGIYRRQN
jgi:hypothetical protein